MKAVYVGSFDPLTNGHVDLIMRSFGIFGRVIVGVGNNIRKQPMFSVEERIELIDTALVEKISKAGLDPRIIVGNLIEVDSFDGLAIDFARKHKAQAIVRGIRNNPDFEAEFAFAHVNTRMAPEIEHVYLMASEKDHFVSSSIVKELWSYGTQYQNMVPQIVFEALEAKRQ